MTEPQHTAAARLAQLEWRWKSFADLTATEVYDMLAARSAVFIVEQDCLYGDIDGLDFDAWHLFAFGPGEPRTPLAGYLRVLLPDTDDTDIRIGRVLTTAPFRGVGLGNALLERALTHIRSQ